MCGQIPQAFKRLLLPISSSWHLLAPSSLSMHSFTGKPCLCHLLHPWEAWAGAQLKGFFSNVFLNVEHTQFYTGSRFSGLILLPLLLFSRQSLTYPRLPLNSVWSWGWALNPSVLHHLVLGLQMFTTQARAEQNVELSHSQKRAVHRVSYSPSFSSLYSTRKNGGFAHSHACLSETSVKNVFLTLWIKETEWGRKNLPKYNSLKKKLKRIKFYN